MNKIFVGGGQLRRSVFRKLEEWEFCKRAMLVEIDPATKSSRNCVEYESPKEAAPDELPAIIFKSPTLRDNKLYACTSTEVMIYDLPSFRLATYISLPFFNDVHHVYPTPQGTLLVMVTGLDIVAEVSLDGEFLRHWDVMGEDTWSIFSKDTDYRKIPTTKPHRAQPLDERFLWVGFTRVRPTKFRENLNWARQRLRNRRPSHIALYDLQSGSCLEEIETEPHGIGVVFKLFQPQFVSARTAPTKAYAQLESMASLGARLAEKQ